MKISLLLALPLLAGAPALASDHIDDLIAKGRAELARGDVDAALGFFNTADAEAKGVLRSRMWVLRAHFEKAERINDAFDEVDALAQENDGPDLDYLYGMGSYFKAKKYLTEQVELSTVGFVLQDAQRFLAAACQADGERYHDAWYPLADSAYQNQDYGAARAALDRVLGLRPDDPGVHHLHGRVLFKLYEAAKVDDEQGAAEHLDAALAAFTHARSALKDPRRYPTLVGDVHLDHGLALQWKGDQEAAIEQYAESIGWNPGGFRYGDYWGSLGLEKFTGLLERGAAKYVEHYGSDNSGDATLLWWLGSTYYSAQRYADCAATYLTVLKKWPAYTNSWFYVAMSRYFQEDYDGAIDAWHENWKADATDLVRSIQSNQELHLQVLGYVIGKCAEKGQPPSFQGEYNVKAAFLCEVRCAADEQNWEYWDNWGLFARDGGEFLRRRASKPEDEQVAAQLFEQAWNAYNEAIRLAPDKPHLYNDAAVILDYYLERDYDVAMGMYEKALEMATRQLEAGGLSEADRGLAETARRDSANNIRKLKEKLEGDGTRSSS